MDIVNKGYIGFIEKYAKEIEEQGSINLKPSDRFTGYQYLREQNVLLVLEDNDNIHSVKLSEKGKILWKIHKFRYSKLND